MSQLNLKQVLSGDSISTVVDKLNYNFNQIMLNGGGPRGSRGLLGSPGLPGNQGEQGETGPTGEKGSYIFSATGITPGDYPFGTGGGNIPNPGDLFISSQGSYFNIWELSPTGAGTWVIGATVTAPSGFFIQVNDQVETGPTHTLVANDYAQVGKFLLGTPDAMGGTAVLASGFGSPTLIAELSYPNLFSNSLATLASSSNQLRLFSTDPNLYSVLGSPSVITNMGGVEHSMEVDLVQNAQIYKIINADTNGEKHFLLSLNSTGDAIMYADTVHRVGIGTSPYAALVARLSVRDSMAVGDVGFYEGATFSSSSGTVIQGNLAVGYNNNTTATGLFYTAQNGTQLVIDTDTSTGVSSNVSSLWISSGKTSPIAPYGTNWWRFNHDGYVNPGNEDYSSLKLTAFRTGLTSSGGTGQAEVMYMSLTGLSGLVAPRIGINNTDPFSLFEVGSGTNRISVGEMLNTTFTEDYMSSFIGFNMHRSPVTGTWLRRSDGTNFSGRAIWTNQRSGLHVSFMSITGTSDTYDTDTEVMEATRISLNMGSIQTADNRMPYTTLDENVGLWVGFGSTGTTGSGNTRSSWRRMVGVFGDGPYASSLGSPAIYATNGITQSYDIASYSSASVLPQYSFYGSDTTGMYHAAGSTVNSNSGIALGLAVGGTSAFVSTGVAGSAKGLMAGIHNPEPFGRLHVGKSLVYHEKREGASGPDFIGYNAYFFEPNQYRRLKGGPSITGATQFGAVRLAFTEMGLTSTANLTRYTNIGTKFEIDVAPIGQTATAIPDPRSGKNYRGIQVSPPPQGPTATYFNLSTHVPQVGIGVQLDGATAGGEDSVDTGKRGTLAVAAQMRLKPYSAGLFGYTIEDSYNIGLYSYDGYPVAGIYAAGGNSTYSDYRNLSLNFIGDSGNSLYEDIGILYAETNIDLDTKYRRRAYFGDGFRLGINETPEAHTTAPGSAGWNVASLVVGGYQYGVVGGGSAISAIMKSSMVIDQTEGSDGTGSNLGLIFKDATILSDGNGRTTTANIATYRGDWIVQYAKDGSASGLNFAKPGDGGFPTPGNAFLWIDDTGSVGVGTTDFSLTSSEVTNFTTSRHGTDISQGFGIQGTSWTTMDTGVPINIKFAVDGGISSTFIITTSDERAKKNIVPLGSTLKGVLELNPVTFEMKDIPGLLNSGFIAQEVEKVYPQLVRVLKDSNYEGGKKTLDYNSFIPLLTKAIQEQQEIIEQKDAQIRELSGKLSTIENALREKGII